MAMAMARKAGDWAFKAFSAGLAFTSVYLAGTFSVNLYRGISWHNAQSKLNEQDSDEQAP